MNLVELARSFLESFFKGEEFEVPEDVKNEFGELKGIFVTLKKEDHLRGCIGFVKPVFPLWKGVIEAVKAAAFSDPRFPPLRKEELGVVKIGISVLGEPKLVEVSKAEDYLEKVDLGKDGLMIECEGRSGLLLPEVATEGGFDVSGFLDCLCMKAGLGKGVWQEKNCKIYKFQTEKFSE